MPTPPGPSEGRVIRLRQNAYGDWSWHLVARRGNLPDEEVASSGDHSYSRKSDARRAAMREHPTVPVEDEAPGEVAPNIEDYPSSPPPEAE